MTQVLLGEHGAMYPLLDLIEARAPWAGLDVTRCLAACLEATLISHACIEEEILTPAVSPHLPPAKPGPTDHDIIRDLLNSAIAATDPAKARKLLLMTVAETRKHFEKEETAIFPVAARELTRQVQEELGSMWAFKRGVRAGRSRDHRCRSVPE
ncbi:MAG: hemerythrin domain-containing protein [Terriglobia bacterium]